MNVQEENCLLQEKAILICLHILSLVEWDKD